ncbi:MAG TPA: PEPxxWA-CTERM sorting domain-containing protein [Phenylobacterium sp.]|nr:PEPxxWA-CTERM sorting domain-containing protein [Phenylobacterium sp.]HLZ74292.1 PEPxxWA-CTERM sorting domain-containing protein [Phenylobacterium sp.]
MKTKLVTAAAFGAMALSASSALASTTIYNSDNTESVTISSVQLQPNPPFAGFASELMPAGFTMIDDFDSPAAAGFLVSGGNIIPAPGASCCDAEPPGDTTSFESVEDSNNPFTVIDTHGALTAISFYMGSPDDYNQVALTINGGLNPIVLNGTDIWGGGEFHGDQSTGFLVTYQFAPNTVHSLTFASTSRSFEFDNLAGISVPEPATWALMIVGFGAAGAMLRGKRRLALTA